MQIEKWYKWPNLLSFHFPEFGTLSCDYVKDCNMLTNIIEIERLSFAGGQEKNTMRLVKSWDMF